MTGGKGNIETEESVSGMIKVMDSISMETTGQFKDYTGKDLPW